MSKLTTEITIKELQYRIHAHENDLTQMWTADYFLNVQKELLALKQAAKNPIGSFHISDGQVEATTDYCRDGEWPVQDGEVLAYAAPVLPKQPEPVVLYIGRELISKEGLELIRDGISEATQLESVCMASTILGGIYHAQPVIPEQANILGYFSFDPEDGAEILKDRQTAIDNCNASIDLYRESMQEEYPDGWSDDVKRVCWGVILQEARGFDAQGIPEDDPNHTYQTLDYRLAPDSTNTVTAQPVSEPGWVSVKDGLPELQLGGIAQYWVYFKANHDGSMCVSQATYINAPFTGEEEEEPDWAMHSESGHPFNAVGWHDRYDHPDYNAYYKPLEFGEVIAYMPIVMPAAPAQESE